jgi:hypothetical protein
MAVHLLSIYERSLFCFVVMRWTGILQIVFLVFFKSFQWGGVHGRGSMTFGLVMQKFLNTEWFLLKLKLNRSWKLQRNLNVPGVLVGRSWWVGFNGIYLIKFGSRMWEILILKWLINSKKPGFGRKNQLRIW